MTNVRWKTLLFPKLAQLRPYAVGSARRSSSHVIKRRIPHLAFYVPRSFGESPATRRSERDRIFPARGFRKAWISARTVAEPRQRRPNGKFQAYEDLLALATFAGARLATIARFEPHRKNSREWVIPDLWSVARVSVRPANFLPGSASAWESVVSTEAVWHSHPIATGRRPRAHLEHVL